MVNLNDRENLSLNSNQDELSILKTLQAVDQQATLLETSLPRTSVSRPVTRVENIGRFQTVAGPLTPGKLR